MNPSTSDAYSLSVPAGLTLDRTGFLELYYFMALNRKLEERLGHLYRQGKVVGGLYSSLGQEACSVGSAYALERGDFLAPMIRNLGALMVRGVKPVDVMAQYCARAIGPTRGKDLNVHFGWVDRGLIAPISVVGALIPVMAGIALEMKMKSKPNVALTYIGDGGMSTTDFHEGMNFAGVHRLPFILIVENNGYAYSTPTSLQANVTDLVTRAPGYGAYGESVDGNNVLAVLDAVRRGRARCLAGEGPVMIEARTFRRKGHAEHDDAGYVPRALVAEWEKKDPLDAYRRYLLANHTVDSEQDIGEIDAKIAVILEDAANEALAAPFPDPSIARENVYG
ncbi:MAG TPA: thiamine pyrophosphate-dependent dehydrogenase E1 component subunit alpha [Candidatus Krumholzibacteria bacterium]|nr:thiamine pyrophosphate-dependent dehydrogenase E1 component subunit alpha [Candidatus Krumholzibacteria bacterium]